MGHYVSSVKSNNGWWHLNDIHRIESSSLVFQKFKDADPYVIVYKATDSILPNSIEEPPTSPSCVSPLPKKSFGDEFSSTPHKNNTISNGYDNILNAVEKDVSLRNDLTEEKKRVVNELFNFQQRQALHSQDNFDGNSSKSNQSKLSNLKGKRSKSRKAVSACERKKRSRLNKTVDEKQEERDRKGNSIFFFVLDF